MDAERADQQQDAKVNRLLLEGDQAFMNGDRHLSHELWREAATLAPYNELVWLALFKVLESDEDRIVCLENVIAINPLNVEARRRLRREQGHPEAPAQPNGAPRKPSTLTPIPMSNDRPLKVVMRGFFIGIGIGLLGVAIAVVFSIILYAV